MRIFSRLLCSGLGLGSAAGCHEYTCVDTATCTGVVAGDSHGLDAGTEPAVSDAALARSTGAVEMQASIDEALSSPTSDGMWSDERQRVLSAHSRCEKTAHLVLRKLSWQWGGSLAWP
jgi:hypothetical protein